MYESGARVKEIAAYIGDLESTTERYYITVRKKIVEGGETKQVVMLPVLVKNEVNRPTGDEMHRGMVRVSENRAM